MQRVFFVPIALLTLATASCELAEALNRQVGEPCGTIFECDDAKGLVCGGLQTCQEPGSANTGELGDACDETTHCRIEYACHPAGACAPPGALPEGSGCDLINYCLEGLACSFPVGGEIAGICKQSGASAKDRNGAACKKLEECTVGGTKLVGDACEDTFDCALGLLCAPSLTGKVCSQLPFYRGRRCDTTRADEGPLRALFEVTQDGSTPDEFYRQPFPADWRKNAQGFIDLSGHAHPSFNLPNDIADRLADMSKVYLRHIEKNVTGFSTTAAAYLRFSGRIDRDTLRGPGEGQTLHFVDIGGGDHQGEAVPFDHDYRQSRGKYICDNRLAIRPIDGYPLRPATTYAMYVTDGVRGKDGDTVGRDADFRRLLGNTPPSGGPLAAAYASFEPLRKWLDDAGTSRDAVLTGTVFTTDDIHAIPRGMALAIEAQDVPAVSEATLCAPGIESPCLDKSPAGVSDAADPLKPTRGCPDRVEDEFHEVHLKISLPIFQKGAAPYLIAGGNIEVDADGVAATERREEVCAALTIPKAGAMPGGGWPIVLYGHGTGGNFRSFTPVSEDEVTGRRDGRAVNAAVLPGGGRMAMLSWDQVQHGPRRAGMDVSPETLFFNFLNPDAARDNTLQGAGDVIALLKFLKNAAFDVPGLGEVTFAADKVMYFGHSQGTVTGPPGLAFTDDVSVVLMSGAGGNLVQSLLNKTQPVNISDAIRFAVADDGVNPFHEILNVLQHFIAPSDTINYGRNLFLEPPAGYAPKHVMHIYGKRDFFAPEANQRALAVAMGVTHLGPQLRAVEGMPVEPDKTTLKANTSAGVTGVMVQYEPSQANVRAQDAFGNLLTNDDGSPAMADKDEYDGHFVSFRNKDRAVDSWQHYLESALDDPAGVPEVLREPAP